MNRRIVALRISIFDMHNFQLCGRQASRLFFHWRSVFFLCALLHNETLWKLIGSLFSWLLALRPMYMRLCVWRAEGGNENRARARICARKMINDGYGFNVIGYNILSNRFRNVSDTGNKSKLIIDPQNYCRWIGRIYHNSTRNHISMAL